MYKVRDILHLLDEESKVIGDIDQGFSKLGDAEHIDEDTLDWIHPNNQSSLDYLKSSKAKVIIAPCFLFKESIENDNDKTIIFTANPILLFSRIANELFVKRPEPGIHPSSNVHPDAKIGINVYIGPLCYIGKCTIGDGCIIHSHVSIEDNVIIGKKVLIKNGARIGQAGFGFVKNEVGEYEKFPQVGKVVLDDEVEIGANTCIDRGSLSITRIGKGSKVDNQVQIAHNVQIGTHCVITGNVSIGGSCVVGNKVWVGPGALIRDGIKVGDGAFISAGSIVIKNVKEGADIIGYPAEDKTIFIKKKKVLYALYKKGDV